MYKLFLAVFLTIAASSAIYAQGVQLGLKVGGSWATRTGESKQLLEARNNLTMRRSFGLHGGVSLSIPASQSGVLSFQPELNYTQRGYGAASADANYRLRDVDHCLDMPLLARLTAKGFFLEAGPLIGARLVSQFKTITAGTRRGTSQSGKPDFLWGYMAGVGYQLASGPLVGLRHNGSLMYGRFINPEGNSVVQVYTGYRFGQKGSKSERP